MALKYNMNKNITVSLLISTYNWKEALELVLESVKLQSLLPDEVIIADDGSQDNTKKLIESFRTVLPIKLRHVWHEDEGFRRTVILNKGIAASNGDYIIQLDGDCIMHKHFVRDHVNLALPSHYLYGSRAHIKEKSLKNLFKHKKVNLNLFSKSVTPKEKVLHSSLLSKIYLKEEKKISSKLRGCNMSFWKEDFLSVNGYNEDMIGWGREDSELAARLINKGVRARRLRYRAIVFHIFHKEASREKFNVNDKILNDCLEQKRIWCNNGVSKYL